MGAGSLGGLLDAAAAVAAVAAASAVDVAAALALLARGACTSHRRRHVAGSNGAAAPAAPYKALDSITCDLSAFPACSFFRVEVREGGGMRGGGGGDGGGT